LLDELTKLSLVLRFVLFTNCGIQHGHFLWVAFVDDTQKKLLFLRERLLRRGMAGGTHFLQSDAINGVCGLIFMCGPPGLGRRQLLAFRGLGLGLDPGIRSS
jgi:hypothetical protein